MIKFETNKGTSSLEVRGTTEELLTDVTSFLKAVLASLEEEDKELGEYVRWVFKNHLMDIVLDDEGKAKIIKEEAKNKAKQVDELLKGLDDIQKLLEAMKNK